jgi:glycosyltransferase involved in cell wall biosynthesis
MTILIATDAWKPQINGVVTTLCKIQELSDEVVFLTPDNFMTHPNPLYPEIRLSFPVQTDLEIFVRMTNPNHIHIATEGPIGLAMRKWCIKNKRLFTTSYHTKFPEFFKAFYGIPLWMTYWYFRWFHNAGRGMFVATPSLAKELTNRGFKNLLTWSRGVDTNMFTYGNGDGGYLLYVGRVSKEKNIKAFLDIKSEYKKVVVGDGPEKNRLMKKYPDVLFVGKKTGDELVEWYRNAKVFVFPSKADTFGLVIIEALACGTPVAAYPCTGPIDILNDTVGCMNDDLSKAVEEAMKCDRTVCRNYAQTYDWNYVTRLFIQTVKNV